MKLGVLNREGEIGLPTLRCGNTQITEKKSSNKNPQG